MVPQAVRPQPVGKLLCGHRLQRVEVERQQLVAVKPRRRLDHAIEIEVANQELAVELLDVAARRPSQQCQIVHHHLGQVARPAKVLHVDLGQVDLQHLRQRSRRLEVKLMVGVGKPSPPFVHGYDVLGRRDAGLRRHLKTEAFHLPSQPDIPLSL